MVPRRETSVENKNRMKQRKISVTGRFFYQFSKSTLMWVIKIRHKKNHLCHSTEYFSWDHSFGSKRSCKRLINHISYADCMVLECSAVFLIPFIIYFSREKKKTRLFLWSIISQNAELHKVERILVRQTK